MRDQFSTCKFLFLKSAANTLLAYILFLQHPNLRKTQRNETILAAATIVALHSCSPPRDIQAEMVNAELVKIDTAFRYTKPTQMLTWRDDNHVDYVTYAPMNNAFAIGSRMIVLVKR